ncbi:hypothetical protein, partial [Ectopseudomonas oleovorans]|uniref:hypothetical protein n=1 Tax=Ectopseudomonas oleovorans TaxID=301 RepID=UPI001ABFCAC6
MAHGESLCRELAALCTLAVITQSTVEFPSSRKDRLRITTFIFHRKVKTTGFQPVSFSATMR